MSRWEEKSVWEAKEYSISVWEAAGSRSRIGSSFQVVGPRTSLKTSLCWKPYAYWL